ncbi:MAG: hypothetical protein ACI814_001760 [Mariniblastus sp.]|jgi:hypothetical protein
MLAEQANQKYWLNLKRISKVIEIHSITLNRIIGSPVLGLMIKAEIGFQPVIAGNH